jgi:hypothetical protein
LCSISSLFSNFVLAKKARMIDIDDETHISSQT